MKKQILIIDDEKTIGLLLESFLSDQYQTVQINDSRLALNWLEENNPDLMICDIQMPGVDGFAFLQTVRERGRTSHTPVIMLSAKAESKDRIRSYQLGAQDYLVKPFNPEELEAVVKKNLSPLHYALSW